MLMWVKVRSALYSPVGACRSKSSRFSSLRWWQKQQVKLAVLVHLSTVKCWLLVCVSETMGTYIAATFTTCLATEQCCCTHLRQLYLFPALLSTGDLTTKCRGRFVPLAKPHNNPESNSLEATAWLQWSTVQQAVITTARHLCNHKSRPRDSTCSADHSTGGAGLNADIQPLEHQRQPGSIPHLHTLELNLQSHNHDFYVGWASATKALP